MHYELGENQNQTGNPKLGSENQTSNHTILKKTEARSQGSRNRGLDTDVMKPQEQKMETTERQRPAVCGERKKGACLIPGDSILQFFVSSILEDPILKFETSKRRKKKVGSFFIVYRFRCCVNCTNCSSPPSLSQLFSCFLSLFFFSLLAKYLVGEKN